MLLRVKCIYFCERKAFKLFRDDEPCLIKLHGSIDDPDGIVFDKSSYQNNDFR